MSILGNSYQQSVGTVYLDLVLKYSSILVNSQTYSVKTLNCNKIC